MLHITEKSNCSGCHACINICPKNCIIMSNDDEGFWYPQVNQDACVNCGVCEKVCPIIHNKEVENTPIAYAAVNKDDRTRLNSSSGGVFTLFAEEVIKNGGVVFGARFDNKYNVMHDYVGDIEGLSKFRGSKYVQSMVGTSYKKVREFLERGRLVLFTGTPCQIGGLQSYLGKEYDNLYCQDIICHGVPSPKVWQKYVSFREKKAGSPVRKISFRHKCEGWKRFSISFVFINDMEYHQTHDKDLMMIAFRQNVCLRPSCYNCAFKTINRQGDITLADFWGIQNVIPEMDDDKGTSLLILNTNKGKKLFNNVKETMEYRVTDLEEAIKYNPCMISSIAHNPQRPAFFKELDSLSFNSLVKKHCTDNYFVRGKRKFFSIFSRMKHAVLKCVEK